MPVTIRNTDIGSHAERAGLKAGDILLSINGHDVCDILDYRYYETERHLELEVQGKDGNRRTVSITKGEYQPIGLEFETYLMDRQRCCRNKCVFCFVDQLPCGMRDSLYFKDDDERLSFLFGNYITLTNLSERELDRIVKMHISPINVSVHATDPELRVQMMKNPHAGDVMERLRFLASGGTKLNCQLVLCPGYNDGAQLERSLDDLMALAPQVQSIALVPVGLTKHRQGLPELRLFTKAEAAQVIATAHRYAAAAFAKYGTMIVWPADEFYLIAEQEIPNAAHYEDFPQLDNGVGMIALMRDEFADAMDWREPDDDVHCAAIATGVSAAPMLGELIDAAKRKWKNAQWKVIPVVNEFFGESITVAGLVTGGDLIKRLRDEDIPGKRLLIPSVMLRHEGDMFLDSVTLEEAAKELGAEIITVPNDGDALLGALLGE